jgi:hypothetical protein
MYTDPFVNPRNTFSQDWEKNDPRVRRDPGKGAFVGVVLGTLLLLGVLVAVFGTGPTGTSDAPISAPPAAPTEAPAN